MTLALFHPAFETVGGAEILVATQAQCLKRAGVDVLVVTLVFDQRKWKDWFEGIEVRVASPPSWLDLLRTEVDRLKRAIPRADECLKGLDTVVACNYPTNWLLGASTTNARRRVWSCTEPARNLHLAETNRHLHARVTTSPGGVTYAEHQYARKLARHARHLKRRSFVELAAVDVEYTKKLDAICAISEYSRDSVRTIYGRTDTEVIYPLVRFPTERVAHRAGLDRRGLRVLAHSRLETLKNVDSVLRGFALFVRKQPGGRLHVVGEGADRERLGALAGELGIAASVTFHGYLPENALQDVYAACDVFALPTFDEPFGMVFPEAAARGLLLVGPDHGGPFEILEGGRIGFVCDPFDAGTLADALHRIWSLSDDEVDKWRSRADESCRARFSEATIAPQLMRAFAKDA